MRKYLPYLLIVGLLFAGTAQATIYQGYQGGTGIGPTATSTCLGEFLQFSSTTPSVTYQCAAVPSSVATTTINGVQGPTFTFSIVNTSTASSITTSSLNLFFNLLKYTSGTDINVAANGVINFVNTPGFISAAITSINGNTTPAQTFTAGTGVAVVSSAGNTTTTNTGVTSFNTATGTVSYFTATNNGVTSTVSGATTTFSLAINGGVTQTCPAGQAVVSSTGTGLIGCSAFATSSASGSGVEGNVQLSNGSGGLESDSLFNYATSSKNLIGSATTSKITLGTAYSTSTFTQNISYTGAIASYTVPAGVTSITFHLYGAGTTDGTASSSGGSTTGTLSVAPGQVLWYAIGGTNSGTTGGFNGGQNNPFAAGSGGHTWVSTTSTFSQATVLLDAGGAGGAQNGLGPGGQGGGVTGGIGNSAGCTAATAGSQTTGGTPAACGTTATITAGTPGAGGAISAQGNSILGSPGGAGYWGGAAGVGSGGGNYSLGAGGSGFATSTNMTATSTATSSLNLGNGSLSLSYAIQIIDSSMGLYNFAVAGNVIISGSSTIITPSISGAIVGIGCDSATSSVDTYISSSTTAFITTPQTYPGAGLSWASYLSASGIVTTQVCSDVTVTPTASKYVVKIIR